MKYLDNNFNSLPDPFVNAVGSIIIHTQQDSMIHANFGTFENVQKFLTADIYPLDVKTSTITIWTFWHFIVRTEFNAIIFTRFSHVFGQNVNRSPIFHCIYEIVSSDNRTSFCRDGLLDLLLTVQRSIILGGGNTVLVAIINLIQLNLFLIHTST